jgi:hypothetical protein
MPANSTIFNRVRNLAAGCFAAAMCRSICLRETSATALEAGCRARGHVAIHRSGRWRAAICSRSAFWTGSPYGARNGNRWCDKTGMPGFLCTSSDMTCGTKRSGRCRSRASSTRRQFCGAPEVGLSATIRKVNSRSSLLAGFLPRRPRFRMIHFRYSLNPERGQRTTVSG